MILINFSHPITAAQIEQIETLTEGVVERVIDCPVHLDIQKPFLAQIQAFINQAGLTAEEWQTEQILVNPPSLAAATSLMLSDVHGRMGYFPSILRISPETDTNPPRFYVAEVLNLQQIRESVRGGRQSL